MFVELQIRFIMFRSTEGDAAAPLKMRNGRRTPSYIHTNIPTTYIFILDPITIRLSRYDPHHPEGRKVREEVNKAAIKDMVAFLDSKPNGIAILDSTNPTHERRMNLVLAVPNHHHHHHHHHYHHHYHHCGNLFYTYFNDL